MASTSVMTTTRAATFTPTVTTTKPSEPTCVELNVLSYLNEYNLITLADLSTNSDVEYKTLVCGLLTSSSSANFAIHLDQSSTKAAQSVLEIARSITPGSSLNVQVGSVSIGQSTDKVSKSNNVQYVVNNNRQFNINGGNQGAQVIFDPKLVGKCDRITEDLKNLSLILSHRTPNNNVTIPSDQPGPLNFNVVTKDSDGFAFFTVPHGNDIFNNQKVQQIEIKNAPAQASLVIINVPGKSIVFDSGNIVGSLTELETRSRVLFNFYEAEEIKMQRNFMGALLAPFATVQTNANIDGATVVKTLSTTSELHKPLLVLPSCLSSPTTQASQTSKTERGLLNFGFYSVRGFDRLLLMTTSSENQFSSFSDVNTLSQFI